MWVGEGEGQSLRLDTLRVDHELAVDYNKETYKYSSDGVYRTLLRGDLEFGIELCFDFLSCLCVPMSCACYRSTIIQHWSIIIYWPIIGR